MVDIGSDSVCNNGDCTVQMITSAIKTAIAGLVMAAVIGLGIMKLQSDIDKLEAAKESLEIKLQIEKSNSEVKEMEYINNINVAVLEARSDERKKVLEDKITRDDSDSVSIDSTRIYLK